MSRDAATASVIGSRFVAEYVTHKRLRLLCEGFDAAEALMDDGVIVAASDELDKAFSCLRRGALDAIRLKDEEGAFEEHFIPLTQRMSEADIRMMWNYLFDYVKKRGRPISKRPIMEAIAAFLELAVDTSWRPHLEELLPRAEMASEFLEAFKAEVVIKPRELRERRPSPIPNSPRERVPEKRSSAPGARSLMPPGYSPSSGSTSTVKRPDGSLTKGSPQSRTSGKSAPSRPSAAKVESIAIEPDSKKSIDNWWESPSTEPLQARPTTNMGTEDCWWLAPPIVTPTTACAVGEPTLSSAPLQGRVTPSGSIISIGGVPQTTPMGAPGDGRTLSASGVTLGQVGSAPMGKALSSVPVTAAATSSDRVIPLMGTVHPKPLAGTSIPLTGIVTTHESASSEAHKSNQGNFAFGSQSTPRSDGFPMSQSFPSSGPQSQQYASPQDQRGSQMPAIGHPRVQQQLPAHVSNPNVINGSTGLNFPIPPNTTQGNFPGQPTNPMMGVGPLMSSMNNKTNPFADLGQWCEEEMKSFPPDGANEMRHDASDEMRRSIFDENPSEKKKKKKKKKEKDNDAGDIPKLRAPRTTGASRSTISGETASGADQSLWDDKSGVFSMFSH